jgi:hypothetical protein
MTFAPSGRSAWHDKFSTPSAAELRNAVPKPAVDLLDALREELRGYPELDEAVVWQGVPWRWTLVYRSRAQTQPAAPGPVLGVAWAYLIPDPLKPQVCIPLTRRQLDLLPLKKFKKPVRDGLIFARQVNGTFWPTWELSTAAPVEELIEFARAKQKLLTTVVTPASALAAAAPR